MTPEQYLAEIDSERFENPAHARAVARGILADLMATQIELEDLRKNAVSAGEQAEELKDILRRVLRDARKVLDFL